MTENNQTPTLFHALKLDNGISISFYDLSKKLAGDRWLIKLKCEALIGVEDEFFESQSISDPDFYSFLKQECRKGLNYIIVKERVFIDEQDIEIVRNDMLQQLEANAIHYMASEHFPRKFFEKKSNELKKQYYINKEMEKLRVSSEDDDDEPADFSACFRD